MRIRRSSSLVVALAATALIAAGCSGGSDDTGSSEPDDATVDTDAEPETTEDDGVDTIATEPTDTASVETEPATETDATETSGSYEPGDIGFRVINVAADPVDAYVRTTGLVEAFPVEQSIATGGVTQLTAPPTDGVFLITEEGADDPTCVVGCDDFVAELNTFTEEGPVRTVVVYEDESGELATLELWEQPGPDRLEQANSMVAPDPTTGLVTVTAVALRDADFGLRLGFDGVEGCATPVNLTNVLVGGNQTPAFAYAGDEADVLLFDNQDDECAETPVGGPFLVSGGPGTRSHLILTGEPGDMGAVSIGFVPTDEGAAEQGGGGSDGGEASAATTEAPTGDRAVAIDQMTEEVADNIGLPPEQSACAATLLVDAIGVDVLLVDGQLVNLDDLPVEYDGPAAEALLSAITECGIDPAIFDG